MKRLSQAGIFGRGALAAVLALAAASLLPRAAAAAQLSLYEWFAVAPIVAAGTVQHDDGKFVLMSLVRVFRGDLAPGTVVRVDVKRANREREEFQSALRLTEDSSYLVLLRRDEHRKGDGPPVFEIVRGVDGTRAVPAEGGEPLLDAVARLVRVQDGKDEILAWQTFRELLEDPNPILVDTALDAFLKFRRGEPSLLPSLRPLLDHPRPDLRAKTAKLVGQIVETKPGDDSLEESGVMADLVGHARRDPVLEVRVAATAALGGVAGRGTDEVLREIARSDPEQAVRYEAERILFERRSSAAPAAAAAAKDAPAGTPAPPRR